MSKKSVGFWLFLIVILGTALRVGRISMDRNIDKDAVLYVNMAIEISERGIRDGFEIMPRVPPLYIMLMAAGEHLGMGAERSGLILSCLAGILLIFPIFYMTRMLFGEKAALVGALLVATQPYMVRDSAEVMRDSIFFLFMFTGLAIALKASLSENFSRLWFPAGILTGLAVMTRSEGMEIIVALIIWIIIGLCRAAKSGYLKKEMRSSILILLYVLAGFMAATVPIQAYLADSSSEWSLVDNRIISYAESFMNLSKKEIILKETR